MALLRGANRPLLTRLINQEVEIESNLQSRSMEDEIDLYSPKVIQCSGNLANLEENDVVRSIGQGKTERLSEVFQYSGSLDPEEPDEEEVEINLLSSNSLDLEEGATDEECSQEEYDVEEGEECNDYENQENPDEQDEDEVAEEEEEDLEAQDQPGIIDDAPEGEPERSGNAAPFGKKKVKTKKKMETGLLKEILDFKPSTRRHAH